MYTDHGDRPRCKGRLDTKVNLDLALGFLPSFDNIVAVTSNACSVLTTTGSYSAVCMPNDDCEEESGLRLSFHRIEFVEAVLVPAVSQGGLPPSIQFRDLDGIAVHTVYLTSAADELALDCLRASFPSPEPFLPGPSKRAAILPFSGGPQRNRSVDRQVIPHLLAYIAALRLPVRLSASNRGCTQSAAGAIDDLFGQGERIVARSGSTTLSFDPTSIRTWRTHSSASGTLRLEALSPDGQRVLALSPNRDPSGHACSCWREILHSLPSAPNS